MNFMMPLASKSILGGIMGGDDPPKKSKAPYDFDAEMKMAYLKPMKYDANRTAKDVLLSAAKKSGIDPALLMASSYQEGLGKAILKPDEVSQAYINASGKGLNSQQFPVDGFYNYGVDTFGNNYEKLKKYLPQGFEGNFQLYDAVNEKKQPIKTAAFRTNEDALVAKAAFMRMEMDNIDDYAKSKGLTLDDKAKKYFTLAAFNGGPGAAKAMMDEYAKSSNKNDYIDKGLTGKKEIHKNIIPRLNRMNLANQLLGQNNIPVNSITSGQR